MPKLLENKFFARFSHVLNTHIVVVVVVDVFVDCFCEKQARKFEFSIRIFALISKESLSEARGRKGQIEIFRLKIESKRTQKLIKTSLQ